MPAPVVPKLVKNKIVSLSPYGFREALSLTIGEVSDYATFICTEKKLTIREETDEPLGKDQVLLRCGPDDGILYRDSFSLPVLKRPDGSKEKFEEKVMFDTDYLGGMCKTVSRADWLDIGIATDNPLDIRYGVTAKKNDLVKLVDGRYLIAPRIEEEV